MSVYILCLSLLLTLPCFLGEIHHNKRRLTATQIRTLQRVVEDLINQEKRNLDEQNKAFLESIATQEKEIDEQVVNKNTQSDKFGVQQTANVPTTQAPQSVPNPHPSPQGLQQSRERHGKDAYIFSREDFLFIVITVACSIAAFVGLIIAGVCWYKFHQNAKAASEVDYPAYGVTGPVKERMAPPGDRKLAQSAQMYHYQHQKQQIIAQEKASGEMKHDASDEESEEENEEGDYTVYECPGLAPTGEMEIRNPMFHEDVQAAPPGSELSRDQN